MSCIRTVRIASWTLLCEYMHDRNLLKYVRYSKRRGVSETEIRKSLEETGWSRKDIERTFEALGGMGGRFFHVHLFHRHVPIGIAILVLVSVIGIAISIPYLYLKRVIQITEVVVPSREGVKIEFTYGSWPELENARFFERLKKNLC